MNRFITGLCIGFSVLILMAGVSLAVFGSEKPTGKEAGKYMSGEAVAGAVLQLIDGQGKVIKEWTSEKKEFVIEAELTEGTTYTLHEKEAPAGYYRAEDITFTVEKGGEWTSIEMKDSPTVTRIKKKDLTTGNDVRGAILQLRSKRGEVLDEWETDGTVHEVIGILKAGETYKIHEYKAPVGYEKGADVEFTVPVQEEPLDVTFYNVKQKDYTPQTGQVLPLIVIFVIGGIALAGSVWFAVVKKKDVEEE